MTAAAADYAGIQRSSLARRILVFVAVLAFALQSYIAQTHIHDVVFGGAAKITNTQSPVKAPLHDSQGDCPFCQAVLHAGAFVASATPSLLLPFVWVKTVALVFTARAASHTAAHDWQSRAPPRL
jgi:hypothetical protein